MVLIGSRGSRDTIIEITVKSYQEIKDFFDKLITACGGNSLIKPHRGGFPNSYEAKFPCGKTISFRSYSNSGPPTIDFSNHFGHIIKKIKFKF